MDEKLFDSERKVMEILWREGDKTAKCISLILAEEIGWNKNTTYTVIKKCIDKGLIERVEPGFLCKANITKEQIVEYDTEAFVNRVFDGSIPLLFSALLRQNKLSKEEVVRLKQLINDME